MEEQKIVNLTKMSSTYKLIIPAEVEAKIRFICNKVWEVEWSGTLFYTHEGSFEDGTLVITAKDIFVMDIGNATYTEFDMSPDVIAYMTEHPELLDYQMGLIHSHNNMSTFFSGTDVGTLKSEGQDRNHFVSLIVNNAGNYTAAITRKLNYHQMIDEYYTYNTFGDEAISHTNPIHEETKESFEYYMLDITKENSSWDFSETEAKLEAIKKAKASSNSQPQKSFYSTYNGNGEFEKWSNKNAQINPYQKELPFDFDDDSTEMPKTNSKKFSNSAVQYLALQIVTGSIAIPNASTIDIKRWIPTMDKVFTKRFGQGRHGMTMYALWVSQFIEFVLWYLEDDKMSATDLTDEELAAIMAQQLLDYFKRLPKNEYMEVINSELEKYLIYGK